MTIDVFAQIWEWDHHGERDRLRALLNLGDALLQLTLSAEEQKQTIPDCPYCEITIPFWSEKSSFEQKCEPLVTPNLKKLLDEIERVLNAMSERESECYNSDIFEGNSWNQARKLAQEALIELQWGDVESSRAHLEMNK